MITGIEHLAIVHVYLLGVNIVKTDKLKYFETILECFKHVESVKFGQPSEPTRKMYLLCSVALYQTNFERMSTCVDPPNFIRQG